MAPIKVASVPKRISGIAAPEKKFPSKHPSVSPGTADRLKNGRMHRASAIRNWIAPKLIGLNNSTSATYTAQITAASVIILVLLS